MAKDYAKNKRKKKKAGASRSKKKSSISTPLLMTTFILVSGLIALLVYLKWYQHDNVITKKTEIVKPKQDKKTKPQKNDSNQIKADDEVPFYRTHKEMLNKTVEIPIEDLKLPEDQHQYEYLMPCGSFRDSARAEELKAQIAFVGFESSINQVQVESDLWHRVELGPFKSKRKTESIRHRLQDHGFEHCKIWRKKIK